MNPLFLAKRIYCEAKARFSPLPKTGVIEVGGVLFDFDYSFSHKVRKMYFHTFQPVVEDVIRRYLKPGDTFIDVGANIGYFSFVAAQQVGKSGKVFSFEPVGEYFERLENFAKMNNDHFIKANKTALGEKDGNADIFIKGGADIGNNTFFPELLSGDFRSKEIVPVRRMDKYIEENKVKRIKLIKIDVEGHEFAVLKGMEEFFKKNMQKKSLPLVICEIVPEIYPLLNSGIEEVFAYMEKFGYFPYEVLNNDKIIKKSNIKNKRVADVLFKPKYVN